MSEQKPEKQTQAALKQELKHAREIAKYSADYDMTQVIRWVFVLFAMLMAGLFVLEILMRIILNKTTQGYLTPEIVHTIFGFVGGWGSAIVTYFFAKKLADHMGQKKQENETTQPQGNPKQ